MSNDVAAGAIPVKKKRKRVTGDMWDIQLLRRIFGLSKPYRSKLWMAVIFTLIGVILATLRPYLVQHTLDVYVAGYNLNGLVKMSAILLLLLLLQTFMQYYQTFATNWLGQTIIKDLRSKVYQHLTRLNLGFFNKTPVGTAVTRTVSDIETIADIFSEGLINISGDVLQILFIVGVMFYTDMELSLISLSVLPLLLLSSYIFKEKVKKSFQDVRNQVARLNAFVQEHITGMHIVQIFNREKAEFVKFKRINKEHRDANIRSVLYYSVFFPVVEIITAMSIGLLVWWGTRGMLSNEVSAGTIIMFIMFINMFFRPIRQLADRVNSLQMGMVAAERIFTLVDDESNLEQSGLLKPEHMTGKVQFDHVWFAYKDDNYVLRDIDFELQPGKTLALVGATGAGKSSIINLLTRFYEINQGVIRIDGNDIRDLNLEWLRKNIAVVLQDVFLFSGSVEDNIRLNHPEITAERIREAAIAVGADTFISRLPGGYQFDVKERGNSLSVGQRQLISFIRALAFDPRILILDEATSSVDSETEYLIQQAIKVLMKGRTAIVIAHRLSTIQNADEIIELEKGEIVERGTHEQLMRNGGYYSRLHEYQTTNVIL